MPPFRPQLLPPDLDWGALVPGIARANAALARYDGHLQGLINPDILLAPLRIREAVLSSRIEGTQATLRDVLEHEADPSRHRDARLADVREVINYRRAILLAVERLGRRPLSLNLLREVHAVLMEGVRGHDRARGEFRRVQNFIGPPGSKLEDATYVPPPPHELMPLLDNLEKYVHGDERDVVVQTALAHAQFELIHPFLDGNGRLGRILIPLILFTKGHLDRPSFYLSAHLEAHRRDYYHRLAAISVDGDHQGWVEFFLEAVAAQAEADTERIRRMLALYEGTKQRVVESTRSQYALQVLDTLFHWPIFSTPQFARNSAIPTPTATRLLKQLEGDVVHVLQPGRGRRPTLWSFPGLLEIVDGADPG